MFNLFTNYFRNKYLQFRGRASRKEYALFSLFIIITFIPTFILTQKYNNSILIVIYAAVISIPYLSLETRRLHDLNLSGWWQVAPIIGSIFISQIISTIFFIGLLIFKGTPTTNKYGDPPTD